CKTVASNGRRVTARLPGGVRGGGAPSRNEEYLLYQTLVGVWPFDHDASADAAFADRIVACMTKAMREAKLPTPGLTPYEKYEKAVERFVRAILDRRRANPFLAIFEPFQQRIAELGIYNSLAQQLVKIPAPGGPDF